MFRSNAFTLYDLNVPNVAKSRLRKRNNAREGASTYYRAQTRPAGLKCDGMGFKNTIHRKVLIALSLLITGFAHGQIRIYVSPAGNDSWSGANSTATGSDGPKATIAGARDEIRKLKSHGALTGGAVVEVAPGSYPQLTTLTLTKVDSGSPQEPIIYRSATLKAAIIEGGISVRNWRDIDSSVASRVDPSIAPHLKCADLKSLGISDFGDLPMATWSGNRPSTAIELFVNGTRQTVARWPATGYAHVGMGIDKLSFTADLGSSNVRTGDPDVWMCGFPSGFDWAYIQEPATIDREAGKVSFPKEQSYINKAGGRFYLKNSLSDLTQPGQYFVDKSTGQVVYFPASDLSSAECYVSANLGPIAKLIDVSNVTFEGFTFEHGRNDAVMLQRTSAVTLRGNSFTQCGGCGVVVQELGGSPGSAHDNLMQSNKLEELGESGIAITAGNRLTLEPANNIVQNNVIIKTGVNIPCVRPGIYLSGVGNRAVHNDISDCPGIGIQIFGNNNIADGNHIWNACMDTDDAGAIYLSGTDASQRGNVVKNNFVEDTYARIPGHTGIWGIYLDGRASGVTVTGNIVKNSNTGLIVNGGRDNLVKNNVMVDCKTAFQIDEASHSQWNSLVSSLKAVDWQHGAYARQYPTLVDILDDDPLSPKGNLITANVALRAEKPSLVRSLYGVHLSSTPSRNKDEIGWTNNIFGASGLFVDEAGGDFKPLPGTEPEKDGFKPVRTSDAGVKADEFIKPGKS